MKPYYSDDDVVLYNCKWEELLPTLETESVALVVTSPPYNKAGSLKGRKGGHTSLWQGYAHRHWYGDEMTAAEYEAWQLYLLETCVRLLVPGGAILYNQKAISLRNEEQHPRDWLLRSRAITIRQTIIWYNRACCQFNNGLFYPFHELLFWLYRRGDKPRWPAADCQGYTSVWDILSDRETDWHPCAFPRELAARCILALSNPGETVLDPFAGAATVGVAAKQLGRKAILCEVREDYCEKSAVRLSQQAMFAGAVEDRCPSQAKMMEVSP